MNPTDALFFLNSVCRFVVINQYHFVIQIIVIIIVIIVIIVIIIITWLKPGRIVGQVN